MNASQLQRRPGTMHLQVSAPLETWRASASCRLFLSIDAIASQSRTLRNSLRHFRNHDCIFSMTAPWELVCCVPSFWPFRRLTSQGNIMRKVLIPLVLGLMAGLTVLNAAAQTPPAANKADSPKADTPPATTTPMPATPPAAAPKTPSAAATTEVRRTKAGTKRRHARRANRHRHARAAYRHRSAHYRGWRNVWVYTAHDRHGYRRYDYVRRKFGGYFATGRDNCFCRRGVHTYHRARHWHI